MSLTETDDRFDFRDDFADIREMTLAAFPQVETASAAERALILRDRVHWRVPVYATGGTDWSELSASYREAVVTSQVGHICGGLSILYMAALGSLGVPARKVSFYEVVEAAPDPVPGHASVDVFIDGRWIAHDPTYNFSLVFNGEPVSWMEAAKLVRTGRYVTVSLDGKEMRDRYKALGLRFPIGDPRNFLTSHLAFVNIGADTFPETWDGIIRYSNRKPFDSVRDSTSKFYRSLSAGIGNRAL